MMGPKTWSLRIFRRFQNLRDVSTKHRWIILAAGPGGIYRVGTDSHLRSDTGPSPHQNLTFDLEFIFQVLESLSSSDRVFNFSSRIVFFNFRFRYSKERESHTKGHRIIIISLETIKNIATAIFIRIQQKYIHILNPSASWLRSFFCFLLVCIRFYFSGYPQQDQVSIPRQKPKLDVVQS